MTDKTTHLTDLFTNLTSALEEAHYQHNRYTDFHETVECASQPDASEYDYAKSRAEENCQEILDFLQDQDQTIEGLSSFHDTIEKIQSLIYDLPDMEELTFELPDPDDFEPPASPDDPELVFGFDFKTAIHDNFIGTLFPLPQDKNSTEAAYLRPWIPMPENFISASIEFTNHHTGTQDETHYMTHNFSMHLRIRCKHTTQTTTTTTPSSSTTLSNDEDGPIKSDHT